MADTPIENLSIEISAADKSAIASFDKLAKTLARLKNAVTGAAPSKAEANRLRDFAQAINAFRGASQVHISSTIATQIERIGNAISNVTSADIQRIRDLGDALRGLNGINTNVDLRVGGNVGQRAAQIAGTNNNLAGATEAATDTRTPGDAEGNLHDRFIALRDAAMETNSILNGTRQAMEEEARAAYLASESTNAVVNTFTRFGVSFNLSEVLKGATSGLRLFSRWAVSAGRSLTKNLLGGLKDSVKGMSQFFASIKRIAMYRLVRSAIKEITKGLSEGLKNLYHWSALLGGTFAKSMDVMATASNYLKNSFAAMVSPLLESLAPAIDLIVDKFVDMFNIVNQIFSMLAGKSTYTVAKKVATAWDDATSSANKSAKELKRTLLSFDEINKLNDNNNGSGSSGKKQADYSGMFETRPVSSLVADMVNSGDFSLIGKTVAQKINDALANINWENIRAKAYGFVDSITSLINGFIEDINPETLGHSLAEAINTASTTIDRFWSKTKWAEAGTKLKTAITQFFEDIDVEKLASAFTGKFRSLVTFVENALPKNVEEWDVIANKIAAFITFSIIKIPWASIGSIIGSLLMGAIRVTKILADKETLTHIAEGVKTAIETALGDITPEEVSEWVKSVLKDVLKAVGVLLSIEIDFGDVKINPILLMAFAGTAVNLIKTAIGNIFGATTVGGLGSSLCFAAGITLGIQAVVQLIDIINGIKNGEGIDWKNVGNWIKSAALATGFFLMSRGHYVAGAVAIGVGLIAEPVIERISNIFKDIKENGFTLDSLWDILETVGGTGIIFAGIGLIKTLFGLKLGMSSVAVEAASGGLGGFVNMAGFTSSFLGVLRKFFATSLGSSFASLGIVGGGIVLGMGIAVAIGLTPEIDAQYSAQAFKNNPTDPTSVYSTAEMGGNLYGTSNPSQLKYLEGHEGDPYYVVDVGVNFTSADNPTYKNKTLGDYIKDAMKKVHPEVFTRVSAVAGSLMQKASNALKPLIDNMTSTDTVEGNPGTAMEWSKGNVSALAPIVNGVSSLDIVNAAAGVGMSGTNSYSLSAITSDTTSTNTVNASAGSGMTSLTNGLQANVSDVTATATIDAKTPWGTFGGAGGVLSHVASTYAVLSTLGINDLYTDVDVGLHKNWWGDPISTLGLNNLFATIYVGIRKAAGSSVTFVPTAGKNGSIVLRKHGGIFSGGFWRDIPQYAGGTTSAHGSMFIAGENGPEVVGHIGGRTEVLNKSQLASAMYSAVHSAMSGVSLDADFHGGSIGNGSEFAEYASKEHEDMRQQNELLRQQNELLRMLYEKDNEWSTSGLSKAQAYVNRRAGTTIIPVGT